jgi:DNA polymerase-3 subunit beta
VRIVVDRAAFLKAAQTCESVTPKRDVKPVLQHLKLVADEGGGCTLSATDLEVGVRLNFTGVKVDGPGECMLPAALVVQIFGAAQDDELTVAADGDRFTVTGASTEFEHPTEAVDHFPDVPAFDKAAYHEVQADALGLAIRRTVPFVAATEHLRFGATTGVAWDVVVDSATLVATNGRHMAVVAVPATKHGKPKGKEGVSSVPAKAMRLLARLVGDEGTVRFAFTPNDACFATDVATVTSRLVEGRFPSWKNVIPGKAAGEFGLAAGVLLDAVKAAAVMTTEETKRLTADFAAGRLTLAGRRGNSGRSKVELPIDYKGKPLKAAYDHKSLALLLGLFDRELELKVGLAGKDGPVVFRAGDDTTCVVAAMADNEGN